MLNILLNYLINNYKDYYKKDYNILYAFCRYFWEGHVVFPKLDIDQFEKNIKYKI